MFKITQFIAPDKLKHLAVGFVLSVVGIVLFKIPVAGLILAGVAGVAKEVYDKVSGKGTPDVYDAVATIAGGAVPFVLAILAT
jgi:uncharacterized membrane-anchored protein YitT (DUF2179 family)